MIWFEKNLSLESLNQLGRNTMSEAIGMRFVEIGEDFLKASMPVDSKTRQPYGLLHGGASCALAETLGSIGSALVVDRSKFLCVGLEINANHVKSARDGIVIGEARPLHLGSSTHVWDIKIRSDDKLICVSRLTVAIIARKS